MSLAHRPLRPADAQAVADLIGDYDAFHSGELDRGSAADVLDWWSNADEQGKIAVTDEGGRIVGVGTLRPRGSHYIADNYVHPDVRGRGIGTLLLDWAERRAAETGKSSVRAATSSRDAAGKQLIESRGYRYIRSFYRMVIDLDESPPAPVWPQDFTVTELEVGEEQLLYETLEEAFADHWGSEPRTFEQWTAHNGPLADRLSYLVRAGDGTAAAAEICDEERFGTGFVAVLGVRPACRRRGLGEALLRLAFQELYERGKRRIALGVDAENTTGATRLYRRVGMEISWQDDVYEKML